MSRDDELAEMKKCLIEWATNWREMWVGNAGDHSAGMVAYYDYLLEHAEFMEPDMVLTRELCEAAGVAPVLKECYHNSLLMRWCAGGERLAVYEGLAVTNDLMFPLDHSWNRRYEGAAIDFTASLWKENRRVLLWGVVLPDEFILQQMTEREVSGPYLRHFIAEQVAKKPKP